MEEQGTWWRSTLRVTVGLTATVLASSTVPAWAEAAPAVVQPRAASSPLGLAAAPAVAQSARSSAAPRSTSSAAAPGAGSPGAAGRTSTAAAPPELLACRYGVAAGEILVAAARPGVGHWQAHVRAGADVLAGRKTSEQVRPVYRYTRGQAPEDIRRYRTAAALYRAPDVQCAQVAQRELPQEHTVAAGACLLRAQAVAAAAVAGREAMSDWIEHAEAMGARRRGEVTVQRHLHHWHEAIRESTGALRRWHQATARLASAPACLPASADDLAAGAARGTSPATAPTPGSGIG